MRTSRGIVWGGLLVILGTFWLLRNMDLIHIQWSAILPYWPVLLIAAGVVLLVTRSGNGISGGLVALLITLAVFGGIVNKTDRILTGTTTKMMSTIATTKTMIKIKIRATSETVEITRGKPSKARTNMKWKIL
jgi:hypothetical protein